MNNNNIEKKNCSKKKKQKRSLNVTIKICLTYCDAEMYSCFFSNFNIFFTLISHLIQCKKKKEIKFSMTKKLKQNCNHKRINKKISINTTICIKLDFLFLILLLPLLKCIPIILLVMILY